MPVSRLAQTVEVTEDGREKKLSLTYDKYDYDGLNSLIIYSKLFLPVLSNFYSVIGDDERDFFRCMRTVDLLGQCELFMSVVIPDCGNSLSITGVVKITMS